MYSALKHKGRPLYEYAREGIEVERPARPVTIYELTLLAVRPDELDLAVKCTKGTYVRNLVEDIGEALGCGAHVCALRRTMASGFTLADAARWRTWSRCGSGASPGWPPGGAGCGAHHVPGADP